MLLGLTQPLELLLLFVALPFVVAAAVIWFVSWRNPDDNVIRTSDVLETGTPADAEVLTIKSYGGFLDTKPMVRFGLRVTSIGAPFEIEVTQSIPRATLKTLARGDVIEIRVTPDHRAAAVVLMPTSEPE